MNPVMFELSGTNFEKGLFELRLQEGARKGLWGRLCQLGPVNGRLVALAFFLLASFLLYFQVLARVLAPWQSLHQAQRTQAWITWGLVAVGGVIYAVALVSQRAKVRVTFDRGRGQVHFHHAAMSRFQPARDSLAGFKEVTSIKVYGPQREPHTPHGFLEITTPTLTDTRLRTLRFQFLSDDQLKIYPLNLSKLTGIEPQGDWVDPGSELNDESLQTS